MNHGMCRSSQSRSLIGDFLRAGVSFEMSNLESALVSDFALDLRPALLADGVVVIAFKSFLASDAFLLLIVVLLSSMADNRTYKHPIPRPFTDLAKSFLLRP